MNPRPPASEEEPLDPAGTVRVVKRYANRKLYDTWERRFTSLSVIEVLVRAGVEVRVVDHDTGADLTDDALAQVLGASVRTGHSRDVVNTLIRTPRRVAEAIIADDRQAEEVRELRAQVEALTRTVAALLAERSERLGGKPD